MPLIMQKMGVYIFKRIVQFPFLKVGGIIDWLATRGPRSASSVPFPKDCAFHFLCDHCHCNLNDDFFYIGLPFINLFYALQLRLFSAVPLNLYDRLQHSFVIDFIDWFIPCTQDGSIQRQIIDFLHHAVV